MNSMKSTSIVIGLVAAGTFTHAADVAVSGKAELNAYANDVYAYGPVEHSYKTIADLNLDISFNEKWSAFLGLEAYGLNAAPGLDYSGAWIKFQPKSNLAFKVGDLTYSEGAFVSYYGYDDPTYYAAGMKEHDIRGFEVNWAGLLLAIGTGRGTNDIDRANDNQGEAYNAHAAYDLNYAGQHLRPYANYKSYQSTDHNELHAGLEAGLTLKGFALRTAYGYHIDYIANDDRLDFTSVAHTILAEPSFEAGSFSIKGTFFYSFLEYNDLDHLEAEAEIPEYMFAYVEPSFKFSEYIRTGIPVEFHTNTLDDKADISTLEMGGRFYITPVENMNITALGMFKIPVGDKKESDDIGLKLGVESQFSF